MFHEQQRKSSCGAACLRNALRLLGLPVTEAKIRHLAGTDGDGTDEFGIAKAAKELGYKCEQFSTEDSEKFDEWLIEKLNSGLPCIVIEDDYDHWVLVVSATLDGYIIHDPAKKDGIRELMNHGARHRFRNDVGEAALEYYGLAVIPDTPETEAMAETAERPTIDELMVFVNS